MDSTARMTLALVILAVGHAGPAVVAAEVVSGSSKIECSLAVAGIGVECPDETLRIETGDAQAVVFEVSWERTSPLHERLFVGLFGNFTCAEFTGNDTCYYAEKKGPSPIRLLLPGAFAVSHTTVSADVEGPHGCDLSQPIGEPPHVDCDVPPVGIVVDQPFQYTWTIET